MNSCLVFGEHTLVYRPIAMTETGDGWGLYGVLAGDVFMGGRNPKNGCTTCHRSELRPATLSDFDRFRVSPAGFFNT